MILRKTGKSARLISFHVSALLILAAFPLAPLPAQNADEIRALTEQADALLSDREFGKALPLELKLHELDPSDLRHIETLGSIYVNLPSDRPGFKNSLRYLLEAQSRYSSNPEVYYNLACVYSAQGMTEQSRTAFEKAVYFGFTDIGAAQKDPDLEGLRKTPRWEMNIAPRKNELAAALRTISTLSTGAQRNSGQGAGRIEAVRDMVSSAFGPDSLTIVPSLFFLAIDYSAAGLHEKALSSLKKSLSLVESRIGPESPDAAQIRAQFGDAYAAAGNLSQSMRSFGEALRIYAKRCGERSIETADVYARMGTVYARCGSYDKTLECEKTALEIMRAVKGENDLEVAKCWYELGGAYFNKKDYDSEIPCLEKALAIQLNLKETAPSDIADTYHQLGRAYCEKCVFNKAIIYYEKALPFRIKVSGENSEDAASLFTDIAAAYAYNIDNRRAEEWYVKALNARLKAQGASSPDAALCYTQLGAFYGIMSRHNEAAQCHEKALAIRIAAFGEKSIEAAESNAKLGDAYAGLGQHSRAFEYHRRALKLCIALEGESSSAAAKCYGPLAFDYLYGLKDNKKALECFQKGLEILQRIPDAEPADIVGMNHGIGLVYQFMGDRDRALPYFEQAMAQIAKLPDSSQVISSSLMLANICASIGELDRAIELEKNALARQEKIPDNGAAASVTLLSLGGSYIRKADADNAIACFQSALPYMEKVGDYDKLLMIYSSLGMAYCQKTDFKNAIVYHEKADALVNRGYSNTFSPMLYPLMSMEYRLQKNRKKSETYFRKALRDIGSSDAYQFSLSTAWLLTASELDGDLSRAKEAVSAGVKAAERARADLSTAKTGMMAKSLPLYYAGVDIEARLGNDGRAFEYSEALRSRGFLDQMGQEAALHLSGVTDIERQKMRTLLSRIDELRSDLERLNALPAAQRDAKSVTQSGAELHAAETELKSLDEKLSSRIPRYAMLRNPRPVGIADAQSWIRSDQVVLEYVLWDPSLEEIIVNTDGRQNAAALTMKPDLRSYCLVISRTGAVAVPLDGKFGYQSSIEELRAGVCNLREPSTFEKPRNELYDRLIAPVLKYIPDETVSVLIVPDSSLSFIPFDTLRADAISPEFGSRYMLSFSPSVSVTMLSSARTVQNSASALTMGSAWYDPEKSAAARGKRGYSRCIRGESDLNASAALSAVQVSLLQKRARQVGAGVYFSEQNFRWDDLPGTEKEIVQLRDDVFRNLKQEVYTGENASEAALKKLSSAGELKKYPFIHLACHGYFDGRVPEMSSVVFSEVSGQLKGDAEDGYLTVPETAVLDLNARMVSLSACETGLSSTRCGDGMVGLARAFLVAGTQAVGVSLWSVDDEATSEFMVGLYRKVVNEGLNFRQAYAKEKAEFRKNPKWNHPYYWSAFTIYE